MKIHLAADHAGFEYKEAVKAHLIEQGVECIDHGAVSVDPTDDYPDFMAPAAQAVAMSNAEGSDSDVAIIFGGSGQGEAMVANRVPGVRAVVYYGGPSDILTLSRAENNANILSLGVRFLTLDEVLQAINIWSEIPFANDPRDIRRIGKF
ncbi:MAG TPA: RpiB/LacA/LacB family sugar-phosphate isomerase [Candidatus Paceibacterota bacterium]|jgi:ribose 5-phosphate isomerase B|nr:RpiB/LacA/LacB family sugar-phosphate isomerase [Candidatus Paceibacterota bacterium]